MMASRDDRCPRCLTAGFTLSWFKAHDGMRPRFTCTNGCGYWSAGLSGGRWMGHEINKRGTVEEAQ